MNGTGSFLAAAGSSVRPATASVRGTSNPAARNAASWATLLISSSSDAPPVDHAAPVSLQPAKHPAGVVLGVRMVPRVRRRAQPRPEHPLGRQLIEVELPSPISHCSYGTAAASSAAPIGVNQSGFSWST